MLPFDRVPSPVPNGSKIAERLLAHARLCRQIADAAVSEDVAQEFERLADECLRAAAELNPGDASQS
ncbi:MAG TPA: hypothetical protein VG986_18870 [Pseudolabrys sp.]|nr:hypothetical protein [Pseudolabrys sp.]